MGRIAAEPAGTAAVIVSMASAFTDLRWSASGLRGGMEPYVCQLHLQEIVAGTAVLAIQHFVIFRR
jgi:hypothetical protein